MPSFTAEENAAFKYLYDQADVEGLGVLTGDKAVEFFAKSKLSVSVLGEIWQIADSDNNGFLTLDRFKIASRLIGHAQKGTDISDDLVDKRGPIPVFEGITIPGVQTAAAAPPATTLAKVAPDDKTKFLRIFLNSGPTNGLLDGEKARDIFIKSNLPFQQLGTIWSLADTKSRGALDATDFIIGMHLIQAAMSGVLPPSGLPATLPPGLYESALVPVSTPVPAPTVAQKQVGILKPQNSGDKTIQRQLTGSRVSFSPQAPANTAVLPASPVAPRMAPQTTGAFNVPSPAAAWDITLAEKQRFDAFFDSLDTKRQGYIEGDTAVPFFLESRLPEAILAQIWDMADIRKEGKLNKDEFAVAMRLINDQLDGKVLPANGMLPLSMVPPSLRSSLPPTSALQPAQQPVQAQPQVSAAAQDLFSLMDDDDVPPAASQPLAPQHTATFVSQPMSPQTTGLRTLSPQTTGTPLTSAFVSEPPKMTTTQAPQLSPAAAQPDPFMPASRSGSSSQFATRSGAQEVPKEPTSQESVQLGQLRNELNASAKGVSTLASQRKEMEETAASVLAEIEDLRARLKTSRENFETETKAVNELTFKAGEQRKELAKAKEELITAESDLSALRDEKRETEASLLRDKEEIRSLKAKLGTVSQQVVAIKAEIEKLKKESKQQKGLLAISKKQLSTAESDHATATADVTSLRQGGSATELPPLAINNASNVSLPRSGISSPSGVSPAGSTRSTNPFDKFMTTLSTALPSTAATATVDKEPQFNTASAQPVETAREVAESAVSPVASADPFATSTAAEAEDPFIPGGLKQGGFQAAFDDNFGNDFVPTNTSQPPAEFDAAFTELDAPAPATSATTQPAGDVATEVLARHDIVEQAPKTETGAPAQDLHLPVTTGIANATSEEDEDATATYPQLSSYDDSASAVVVQRYESSDEDEPEAPEDLDGPRRRAAPSSTTATAVQLGNSFSNNRRSSASSSALDAFEDAQSNPIADAPLESEAPAAIPLPGAYVSSAAQPAATVTTQPKDVSPVSAQDGFNEFDNFDKEFVNLSPTAAAHGVDSQGAVNFDEDFDMDDFNDEDFAAPGTVTITQPYSQAQSGFDSAFGQPVHASAAASSGFDDAFTGFTSQSQTASTATTAQSDDAPALKELQHMGFPRNKAIEALEKNNYSLEQALNSLL